MLHIPGRHTGQWADDNLERKFSWVGVPASPNLFQQHVRLAEVHIALRSVLKYHVVESLPYPFIHSPPIVRKCCDKCTANSECAAWTFHTKPPDNSTDDCFLKDNVKPEVPPRPVRVRTAVFTGCDNRHCIALRLPRVTHRGVVENESCWLLIENTLQIFKGFGVASSEFVKGLALHVVVHAPTHRVLHRIAHGLALPVINVPTHRVCIALHRVTFVANTAFSPSFFSFFIGHRPVDKMNKTMSGLRGACSSH